MKTDGLLLLGRVLMSVLFLLAGLLKLVTAAATQQQLAQMGLPAPVLGWLVAVIIEVGGGLALLLGLKTRPVAAVLGLWCIATALVAHSHFADPAMRVHFMKNLVMAGGFVYVTVFGAGAYSLDALLKARAERAR